LKRALGYEYEETKVMVDADGKKRVERIKKQVQPDVTAQIFWLKNRRPDRWRDKQELETTENTKTVIVRGEDEMRKALNEK